MADESAAVTYEFTEQPPQPMPAENVPRASQPYIGRWNGLVSTTNWEKGRIIFQWREALSEAGAPASEFSDEAWSRLVGGVTGQHAGRLRRVFSRFGGVHGDYQGLFWSHFFAALEWDDAEMWLEGSVQSKWTVAEMRRTRWETLSGPPQDEPRDEDNVSGELDEDYEPALNEEPPTRGPATKTVGGQREVSSPAHSEEEEDAAAREWQPPEDANSSRDRGEAPAANSEPRVRPFAELPELPDDVAEAFESYKLAILRHKSDGWQSISQDDLLASIDALRQLALAPSGDAAPF